MDVTVVVTHLGGSTMLGEDVQQPLAIRPRSRWSATIRLPQSLLLIYPEATPQPVAVAFAADNWLARAVQHIRDLVQHGAPGHESASIELLPVGAPLS
jgi:hypothetical protein